MIDLTPLRRWRVAAISFAVLFVLSAIVGTITVSDRDQQLTVVRDSLHVALDSIDRAASTLAQLQRERQAARDSAQVEQVLRDSLYRVAAARRTEARHWRELVASLPLQSTVDTLPLLEQVRQLRTENASLRAAGDAVAMTVVLHEQTIADLQASDARERSNAKTAEERAVKAEQALAAQLASARRAIAASITAARRPWWKKAGTAIKDRAKDTGVFIAGVFVGRHT